VINFFIRIDEKYSSNQVVTVIAANDPIVEVIKVEQESE